MLGPGLLRLLIETGEVQPADVRGIARAGADAACVAVDEIAAPICGLEYRREAENTHNSRAPQRDPRRLYAALRRAERYDLQQRDDEEDVPCPMARVFMIHDGLPSSRNALHRSMRVEPGVHGQRGGKGAEDQTRRGRWPGEGRAAGE